MGFWDACKTVISGIANAVKNLAPVAAKIGMQLNAALTVVSAVIQVLGVLGNILKPEEKIEEKGEQVLQAEEAGITPENYGSFKEYQEEIDKFEIDPEKRHSDTERMSAGIDYVAMGLQESSPEVGRLDLLYPLMAVEPQFFNDQRLKSYMETAKELGVVLSSMRGYFDGTATYRDSIQTEKFLHQAEKNFNPQYNEKDFSMLLAVISSNMRNVL